MNQKVENKDSESIYIFNILAPKSRDKDIYSTYYGSDLDVTKKVWIPPDL
jgi:hypothetical protein